MVSIKHIDEPQDWEQSGNFSNYWVGLQKYPILQLPTFETPIIYDASSVASWKLYFVDIYARTKTITEFCDLPIEELIKETNNGLSRWIFKAKNTYSSLGIKTGIYEYHITFDNGKTYASDLFCVSEDITFSEDYYYLDYDHYTDYS